MKTLYIDCGMGAAGDMLTAALLELVPDKDGFIMRLNRIWDRSLKNVRTVTERTEKCGITGTGVHVLVDGVPEHEHGHGHGHSHEADHIHEDGHGHHNDHANTHDEHLHDGHDIVPDARHDHDDHHVSHHHVSMNDIMSTIDEMEIPEGVKKAAKTVYQSIAEAESKVHGKPVTEIHFHEVGMADAIADVVSVCLLMDEIGADRVIASPINTGSGTVRCAHGVMPVPAPATAELLRGLPVYGGDESGELCTPTGAALLRYYVNEFGNMPVMKVSGIGYGMGHKDFDRPNCVRVMFGEISAREEVAGLACNIDDMTGEEMGYATERLLKEGAREAYVIPVFMKKSRPGYELRVLCDINDRDRMVESIFRYTTTIGIRESAYKRYVMDRTVDEMYTSYGNVRIKRSSGYGSEKSKYEYDDLSAIADKEEIGLREAKEKVGYDRISRQIPDQ